MKRCIRCNIEKSLEEFYKDNRHTDGLFSECKQCASSRIRKHYQTNKEKFKIQKRIYYQENKNKIKNQHRKYIKNRRKNDLNFRIRSNLSRRLLLWLNGMNKSKSILKLIGCSVEFLKIYLQNRFTNGMSWDNYGKWEIDHIKPCSKFNFLDLKEQRKCFHYTNLQPLWSQINKQKGNK
jgi:hypothetical protein